MGIGERWGAWTCRGRRLLPGGLLVVAWVTAQTLGVVPAEAAGNANFLVGVRSLDDDVWAPVSDQVTFGATVDFDVKDWPVRLAAGLYTSEKSRSRGRTEARVSVTELAFGVLFPWDVRGPVTPYVGGGSVLVLLRQDFTYYDPVTQTLYDSNDSDLSPGLVLQGGFFARIGDEFNIGLDTRFLLGTDFEVFDENADVDYFQTGLIVGWGW